MISVRPPSRIWKHWAIPSVLAQDSQQYSSTTPYKAKSASQNHTTEDQINHIYISKKTKSREAVINWRNGMTKVKYSVLSTYWQNQPIQDSS